MANRGTAVTNRLDGAAFEDSFLNRDDGFAPYSGTAWEANMAKIIEAANSDAISSACSDPRDRRRA